MTQTKLSILGLGLAVICVIATGCAGIKRMEAVKDAMDRGLISGLSSSNHLSAIVWSFPQMPSGPYSKIDSMPVTIKSGSTNEDAYVFFFGRSDKAQSWEVFSCMKWQANQWQLIPVTLPRQ